MQRAEFDNLMDGKPAKIAKMFNNMPHVDGLGSLLQRAKGANATEGDITAAREEIKKHEVDMSAEMRSKIDSFIAKERAANKSERAIRRMVERKFNIQVV